MTTKATTKTTKKTTTTTTPTPMTEDINLSDIKVDPDVQQRVAPDLKTIDSYAVDMEQGDSFPTMRIFHDPDGINWLGDGFHRYAAYTKAGKESAPCLIVEGTRDDAILYAATTANRKHGLHMSPADKRLAAGNVLRLRPDWGNREIARKVGVSHVFVGKLRDGNVTTPDAPTVLSDEHRQQVITDLEGCVEFARGGCDPQELQDVLQQVVGKLRSSLKAARQATAPLSPVTFPQPNMVTVNMGSMPEATPAPKFAGAGKPVPAPVDQTTE